MRDYSKSKIYMIISIHTDKFYIGSTTQTLAQRLSKHVSDYKNNRYGSSQEIIKLGDYKIILICKYPCDDLEDLNKREQEEMDKYDKCNLVNCINAYMPQREYNKKNKEQINMKQREYNNKNKEQIKIRRRKHYQQNKEHIKGCKKYKTFIFGLLVDVF